MAERAASVPYTGTTSVEAGGGGGTPLNAHADAADFGGQVGGALQQAGGQVEDTATKFQGMLFETAANNAEVDYIKQAGELTGKFRTLEGSAAQAALPQYQEDMTNLRQSIKSTLPMGAARMFDATTTKHEAYAISDAYSYGATQVKKATLDSNNAVAQTAISQAGDISVASDDARFGSKLGDIHHSVLSMMELQGYGAYTHTDPDTGKVTFDSSTEGKQASNMYQQELEKRTSAAWEARIRTLSDQNISTANKVFQDNIDKIPGEAQVKIAQFMTPRVRDYDARSIADDTIGNAMQDYRQKYLSGVGGKNIDDAISTQEWRGKGPAPDSIDGAVGNHQIMPDTFALYAKPGEDVHNAADNAAVYKRIIDDYKQRYNGDPARIAVAYFSGTGNVSPPGSPNPWITNTHDGNNNYVSKYVSDVMGRVGGVGPVQPAPMTQADYLRSNEGQIVDTVRAQAKQQHPDDPQFEDNAVAKAQTFIGRKVKEQTDNYKADTDVVQKLINQGAASVDEITKTPEGNAAWQRILTERPQVATAIEQHLVVAKAKGTYNDSNPVGYTATESRLFLPRGDPKAITDESQLWPLVNDKTITPKDREELAKQMNAMQNPKDATEAALKKNVVDSALNNILPAKMRSQGFSSPEMDGRMQNARIAIQQADEDAIKAGKTAQQRYSPDSKDFVGNAAKPFLPTVADKLSVAQKQTNTSATLPKEGDTVKGYKFLGGNPADKNSWQKL